MDIRAPGNSTSFSTDAPPKPYAILGSGDFALEVFWNIFDAYSNFFNTAQNYAHIPSYFVFIDETLSAPNQISTGKGVISVVKNWLLDRDYQFVVGVEDFTDRQARVFKAIQKGLVPAATVIHPSAVVQNPASIGVGGVIAPGCVVTTGTIGNYVVMHPNAVVRHQTIPDFSTVVP
jgi:hypothetical protein